MGSLLRSTYSMKPQSPKAAASFHMSGFVVSEFQMGVFGMALLIFQGALLTSAMTPETSNGKLENRRNVACSREF